MPRIHGEPQALTLHKRIEALTKRVEKLDREVFKAIRIDAENCMPPEAEIRQAVAEEARQAVRDVMGDIVRAEIQGMTRNELRGALLGLLLDMGLVRQVPPQEPAA